MKLCRTNVHLLTGSRRKSQHKHPQKVNIRTIKLIQIRDCSPSEIDDVVIRRVIYQSQQITGNNSDACTRTKRSEIPVSIILSSRIFCSLLSIDGFLFSDRTSIVRHTLLKYFMQKNLITLTASHSKILHVIETFPRSQVRCKRGAWKSD